MREIIEQIVAYPQGRRCRDARRDPALHQAVLAEQRPLQQPHRAQVRAARPRRTRSRRRSMPSAKGGAKFMTGEETIDSKLARLQPMFFDPNVDPIVTNKTPGAGKDILQASANNLYSGVSMADLKGFTEKYGLNSRLVKQDGKLVEEVYAIDGTVRQLHHRDRQAPRSRQAVRRTADGQGARRADQVLSHRRGRRSQGLRHRVGAGQGLAGRHHQRLHRGLPRSARRQGQLGRAGLLRQPGEDAAHQDPRHQRAVVRGPHAVGRRSTASPASRASSPTPSTWSSKPATPVR